MNEISYGRLDENGPVLPAPDAEFDRLDVSAVRAAWAGFGFSVEDVDAEFVSGAMRGAALSVADYWPDTPG